MAARATSLSNSTRPPGPDIARKPARVASSSAGACGPDRRASGGAGPLAAARSDCDPTRSGRRDCRASSRRPPLPGTPVLADPPPRTGGRRTPPARGLRSSRGRRPARRPTRAALRAKGLAPRARRRMRRTAAQVGRQASVGRRARCRGTDHLPDAGHRRVTPPRGIRRSGALGQRSVRQALPDPPSNRGCRADGGHRAPDATTSAAARPPTRTIGRAEPGLPGSPPHRRTGGAESSCRCQALPRRAPPEGARQAPHRATRAAAQARSRARAVARSDTPWPPSHCHTVALSRSQSCASARPVVGNPQRRLRVTNARSARVRGWGHTSASAAQIAGLMPPADQGGEHQADGLAQASARTARRPSGDCRR